MSVIEQLWSRPTAEINGIFGDYTGSRQEGGDPGARHRQALLPPRPQSAAGADPGWAAPLYRGTPAQGLHRVLFRRRQIASRRRRHDNPGIRRCRDRARAGMGPRSFLGSGASIPIVEAFQTRLGMDSLLVGFALEDDRIHSPNEKYNVRSFTKGREELGETPRRARHDR